MLFKNYFADVKKEAIQLLSYFKKLAALIAFRRLKRKANRLHKKYNTQVFIVKYAGKITVLSKYQFKILRQNGKFPKSFTADSLKKIALYHTPKTYETKPAKFHTTLKRKTLPYDKKRT